MKVRITWNEAEFRRILDTQTVPQAVWRAAGKVRDRAKRNITRVNTGALRNSITAQRLRGGKAGVWYEVGSNLPYAIFQHEGTPQSNPGGLIYPRRATVLRFKPKGSNTYVFAKKVHGIQGTPYLTDALRSLSISDFGK